MDPASNAQALGIVVLGLLALLIVGALYVHNWYRYGRALDADGERAERAAPPPPRLREDDQREVLRREHFMAAEDPDIQVRVRSVSER